MRRIYRAVGPDGKRQHTVAEIAEAVGVHRTTVYDYLEEGALTLYGVSQGGYWITRAVAFERCLVALRARLNPMISSRRSPIRPWWMCRRGGPCTWHRKPRPPGGHSRGFTLDW